MELYVLYHANCPDGFGAALVCWQQFGDSATYIPVKYGEPPPEIPDGTDIFIVDFSYPADVLTEMVSRGRKTVTILDHHRTAEQELSGLRHQHMDIHFDMDESGATLTWKFFNGHLGADAPVPAFLQYLRDRDLWLWEIEGSKEFSAALASYTKDFRLWNAMIGQDNMLVEEGISILRYQDKLVDSLCRNAELSELAGYRIMACNTPLLSSEIGNKLCEENPDISFAICYSRQADGRWRHELRSVGDFDVSEVAKACGGGGHKNAAGFISIGPMVVTL
jgi:oligoribonuclease NrnB/cAMP/cGMP phosphodiesterase (DHH superfamily)